MLLPIDPFTDVRVPDDFVTKGKPHVARMFGEWWVVWPTMHEPSMQEHKLFGTFIRRLNGQIEPQPTSVYLPAPKALQ